MSAPALSQSAPALWARTRALSAEVTAPGALAFAVLLLAVVSWGTWGNLGSDTGYDWLAASRIADGQLPYADFVYYYGPLGPFLLGAVYAVLGAGVGAAVALGLVLAAAMVALTYALARCWCGPVPSALAGALAATAAFDTGNTSVVLAHTIAAPLAIACVLAGLLSLARFEATGRDASLLAAGTAAGAAALTRPESAVALWVALAAWLVLRALDRLPVRRALALIAGPALAIPALVYGLIVTAVSPRALLEDNLFPVGQLGEAGKHILRATAPLTAGSVVTLAAHVVVYAAGAAALVVWARAAGRPDGRLARLVGGIVAVAAVGLVAARPEVVRGHLDLAYAWIPAGAVVALVWVLARPREHGPDRRSLAALLVALAVLGLPVYGEFKPYATLFSSKSAYVMPVAAVFLAWMHTVALPRGRRTVAIAGAGWLAFLAIAGAALVARDADSQTFTVHGPHGALAADPETGPVLQQALDTIARESRPGEPILLAPQLTGLYVMSGRVDPLENLSLLPGALTVEQQRAAVPRLAGVRLAIVDRRAFSEYGHGTFGITFDTEIARWMRTHLEHTATLRGAGPSPRILDVWSKE